MTPAKADRTIEIIALLSAVFVALATYAGAL
jgi:hypothetical protein